MSGVAASFRAGFLRVSREGAMCVAWAGGLLLLCLAPAGTAFGFYEEEALVRDVGISSVFVGFLVAGALAAGISAPSRSVLSVMSLRPSGGLAFVVGSLSGGLAAAGLAGGSLCFCGFVLLRHRPGVFSDWRSFLLVGVVLGGSILAGAVRHFRRNRPFVETCLPAAFLLSACACAGAFLWGPGGELRLSLREEDILLCQALLITCFCGIAAFCAVGAACLVAGRGAGVVAGLFLVGLGIVSESVGQLPSYFKDVVLCLVPDVGMVWSGEVFYADLLALPWRFVLLGCFYLSLWSLGISFVAAAVAVSMRARPPRGAALKDL